MKFLLMICADVSRVPDDAFQKGCEGWTEEMQTRGVLLPGGAGLRSPDGQYAASKPRPTTRPRVQTTAMPAS